MEITILPRGLHGETKILKPYFVHQKRFQLVHSDRERAGMAENNCLEKKNLKKKGLVGSHSAAFYFFRFSGGGGVSIISLLSRMHAALILGTNPGGKGRSSPTSPVIVLNPTRSRLADLFPHCFDVQGDTIF